MSYAFPTQSGANPSSQKFNLKNEMPYLTTAEQDPGSVNVPFVQSVSKFIQASVMMRDYAKNPEKYIEAREAALVALTGNAGQLGTCRDAFAQYIGANFPTYNVEEKNRVIAEGYGKLNDLFLGAAVQASPYGNLGLQTLAGDTVGGQVDYSGGNIAGNPVAGAPKNNPMKGIKKLKQRKKRKGQKSRYGQGGL